MQRRYSVKCIECGEIEADTSDDGLFNKAQAHRRAGHHEGALEHSCKVIVAEEELTDMEEWEQHSEGIYYDEPDKPGEQWSSEDWKLVADQHINRRVKWFCDMCSGQGPISTLEKARRHMESHNEKLVEKHETPREEMDTATDGGHSQTTVDESQNSLTDYDTEPDGDVDE